MYPGIASATLQTALVLGDVASVEARLRDHPELTTRPGGAQHWEPLLYVCHTCLHQDVPARADGLVAVATRLCALGANPNAEYHWNWHPELPRTALWGAICAVRHLPLAQVLLDADVRLAPVPSARRDRARKSFCATRESRRRRRSCSVVGSPCPLP